MTLQHMPECWGISCLWEGFWENEWGNTWGSNEIMYVEVVWKRKHNGLYKCVIICKAYSLVHIYIQEHLRAFWL